METFLCPRRKFTPRGTYALAILHVDGSSHAPPEQHPLPEQVSQLEPTVARGVLMRWWSVVRRVGFALVAAYLVISVIFGFVMLTDDPNEALLRHEMARGGANATEIQEALHEYREDRGRIAPLHVQYARWMVGTMTLNWGVSPTYEMKVTDLLAQRLPKTAMYVVPAMVLSVLGGLAIGLTSAMSHNSMLDKLGTFGSYLGLSLPNYFLAIVLTTVLAGKFLAPGYLIGVVYPTLVLSTTLLAGQVQHMRAKGLEYANEEFIKLVRAKGASNWRVARHIARNAAIPLLSLFFVDMLGVVVLNVFVLEAVFGIQGIGTLAIGAFTSRDLPVLLGVTTVVMIVGIFGNLLQDFAYTALDPRVESME